ncbi:uncharacterized protein LOC124701022 [Lolium rigidum]|uniref:uncharacterized protein LOC124701022 n=1 Tax=Lolium rigidum TaxID=89674 RepID=UPI001F5E0666|nr:uncharacterized protein LOC124701022 [Lolium rigidum]
MGFWQRDCCDCGSCSWTTVAIWAAVAAVIAAVLTVLIIAFAVFKPPTATADDALLTRFSLSASPNSTQLLSSYNVTVTMSLRNPNMYRSISYGAMAAAFSFNGTRFEDDATVLPFDQGAKKATTVRVTVGGVAKALPKLSAAGPTEFAREKEAGQFQVEARLDGVMQYKGRSNKCPVAVICPLLLQLVDPDVAATAFERTKCTILRAKTSGC